MLFLEIKIFNKYLRNKQSFFNLFKDFYHLKKFKSQIKQYFSKILIFCKEILSSRR